MNQQDIAAAKAARKSTLKSLKAKRECRIKAIQEKAAEEIRQVNIEFASDPERLKAKYAADAAYKSERARRRAAKAQERAEKRIAYEIKKKKEERLFSFAEEVFNSITIGIGAGLSVAALILLIVRAVVLSENLIAGRTVVSYVLAGTFLFAMYLMSTLAHALPSYVARRVFRVLSYDFGFCWVAAIVSLIGLVVIKGCAGWVLFGLNWLLCIFSIAFYSSMGAKPAARKTGMKICLLCAVAEVAFAFVKLFAVSLVSAKLLVLAVSAFLVGEIFHAMKRVRWTNSIFHLMAILTNLFCFFALFFILGISAK